MTGDHCRLQYFEACARCPEDFWLDEGTIRQWNRKVGETIVTVPASLLYAAQKNSENTVSQRYEEKQHVGRQPGASIKHAEEDQIKSVLGQ